MKFPRTIYAIQHNVTKRIYVGSSCCVENRYRSHISALRSGKHPVEDMQQDFIDYGEDFSLFVLEEIDEWEGRIKEKEWMEYYHSHIRGKGYNYKDNYFRRNEIRINVPLKTGKPEVASQDTLSKEGEE